jgi:hypothetical protein
MRAKWKVYFFPRPNQHHAGLPLKRKTPMFFSAFLEVP